MTAASHPLWGIFEALSRVPRADGRAKIIALVSPFTKSGTSHVARDLSLLAAQHFVQMGGRVALMDFDVNQQTQCDGFDTPESIAAHGAIQGPFDATFGQSPYWQVSPDMVSGDGQMAQMSLHCGLFFVGETGLAVSSFDWKTIKAGQTVHVRRAPEYWQAARSQFSFIFVDCPSTDRSGMAMEMIPDADMAVIISPEYRASDPAHDALAQKITQAGGTCAGKILNAGPVVQPYVGAIG